MDKKWIPAKVVHTYGAGPWKRVFDRAIQTKPGQNPFDGPSVRAALVKNDFLMRSLGRPHRDQVVTSRPAELTMLQAIDLANGAILSKYLNAGANNLKAKAGESDKFINWLYEHTRSAPNHGRTRNYFFGNHRPQGFPTSGRPTMACLYAA